MNPHVTLFVKELKGMRLAAAALLVVTLVLVLFVVDAAGDGNSQGGALAVLLLALPYLCPPLLAGLLIHAVSAEWGADTQHQWLALPMSHAALLLTKAAATITLGVGVFAINTAGLHYVHQNVVVSLTPMFPPLNEITPAQIWAVSGSLYGGYTIYLVGLACLAAAARTRVARFQSLATVGVFLLGIWVSGTLQDPVSLVLRELFASDGLWTAHAEEVYIASAHRVLMGAIFAALGAWLFARYADA